MNIGHASIVLHLQSTMASLYISTTLNSVSLFLISWTEIKRGTLMSLLRLVAHTYHLRAVEAVHTYVDVMNAVQKNSWLQTAREYLFSTMHGWIYKHPSTGHRWKKKQSSELNAKNLDEHVYCVIQEIMLQNNGHKYLNWIFDSAMIVCVIQFKYVLNSLANSSI